MSEAHLEDGEWVGGRDAENEAFEAVYIRRGLTEEEFDFLRNHEGPMFAGLFATAAGEKYVSPRQEIAEAVQGVVTRMEAEYPNRTVRLAMLADLAASAAKARDALLEELLIAGMAWHQMDDGTWSWNCLADYEFHYIVRICGLSMTTVKRRYKELYQRIWREKNPEVILNDH